MPTPSPGTPRSSDAREPRPGGRAERIEQHFHDALGIADLVERAAYLEQRCGSDAELRAEVQDLLSAHEAPGFLEGRAIEPSVEGAGERIGRYRLLQEIGEGGFGTVWMAEQIEPVTRRVALKILKLGMDTREVVARFEQERQALAMMDHPNIAKVFDAGATASGRPYFVMELVKGIPITRFCDEHELDTKERLQLFGDLCSAINHAHQKGVIHRDIKPSNVMVTLHGDKAVVKVIDFGIAKAMQGRLTEKTLFTRFEQFVGTPVYMSPEQAVMSGLDVDTRSDIYALGILLYELLTGKPPLDAATLVSAGWEEMRRIIREVEPPKPSTRLSTIAGEERKAVARARQAAPERLDRLIEPDLDWIVMKAIEKDRARRYETANGFAQDIERYLANEPVSATPPSATYRFRKFARRNRTALRVAALISLVLVSATALSAYQAWRATYAEQEQRGLRITADEARKRAEESELHAREEAKKAKQTAQLLNTILISLDPRVTKGTPEEVLGWVLKGASQRAAYELRGQPELEIEVLATIVSACAEFGLRAQACDLALRAVALGQLAYGPNDPRISRLLMTASEQSFLYGRLAEAQVLGLRAVEVHRSTSGAEHAKTLEARMELGSLFLDYGDLAEAERLLRESLAHSLRLNSEDHATTVECRRLLAFALAKQERRDEASYLLREALASCARTSGAASPQTTKMRLSVLGLLREQGKIEEALEFAEDFGQESRAENGEHIEVARFAYEYGKLLLDAQREAESKEQFALALSMAQRIDGPSSPLIDEIVRELRAWYETRGRSAELEALLREWGTSEALDPTTRFEASIQSLVRRLEVDPTDALSALDLAARQAWLGRMDAWRETAHSILAYSYDGLHADSAERAAKAALLVPGADHAMIDRARALARAAVESGKDWALSPWFELCAGMAEFRAGNDEKAEEHLASLDKAQAVVRSTAMVYRAMIAMRAQRFDRAAALLESAQGDMRPLPADAWAPFVDGGTHDDLIYWLAWKEAEAMRNGR